MTDQVAAGKREPDTIFVAEPVARLLHYRPADLQAPTGFLVPPPPFTRLERAQFWLEAAGFDLGARLIHALGPDRAGAIGSACWRRLAPLNKRHKRAEGHIRAAMPELGDQEIVRLLDEMWGNLGRTSVEAFHIAQLIREQDRFTIAPEFHDAIRVAKARGAVFVSLHQGNWELASPLLHHHGLPVAGVYQKLRNPIVDQRSNVARGPFYALGLYSKGNETARRLLRVVGERGTVTIMADLRDLSGVNVPFFGQPAPSTLFPALLARGRDVPIFAGVVNRRDGATFEAKVAEIPVARSGDRDTDLMETTAAIQRQFEVFIREKPGQWMWGHRRWKR